MGSSRPLVRVVLGEFYSQAPGLHANRGVTLRIESSGTAQNFGGNLILLQRDAGVIKGMFGEVAKQLAQGFGAVQAMTFNKFIYLLEALLAGRVRKCESQPYHDEVTELRILL